MQVYIRLLLLTALLLPPGAWSGEIIGGREARPHSRPYMAYLKIHHGKKFSRCGGFLVSEDFVLTAAHCNEGKITAYLGAHDISKRERSQQNIPVRVKVPHPRYEKGTANNDIMLLQLKKKAKLNKNVAIISLPLAHQPVPPGTKCSVAGWGRTSADRELISNRLREADVVVVPDAACPYRHYHPSTMMCAGDRNEGKSSSKGDSGGPLVCGRTAQGIVSLIHNSGTPPRVYSRVSTFIPWIEETMKRLQT